MTFRNSWLGWVALALVAALAGFWVASQRDGAAPELTSGTWFPQPRPIGPHALTDDGGRPFGFRDLEGAPTLVFFGFTHCPDVCPTTLAQLSQVKERSGMDKLRVLLVTVDPERDDPASLRKYVRAFDPSFIGATGEPETIAAVAREFGVAISRVDLPGGSYTVDHSAAVFLLDGQARIVAVFTPPFDLERFAADVRTAEPWL